MSYFPFFIDLEEKWCLVVGGGEVAYRKVQALLEFGGNVHIVSLEYSEQLLQLEKKVKNQDKLFLEKREFRENDLEDVLFVIAATDEEALNQKIAAFCKKKNIMVNVVDDKEKCSFFFPSFVKREEIVVGISSGGNSPVLAKKIRKKVESAIPDYYGDLNRQLGEIREFVKENIERETLRKQCFEQLVQESEEKKRAFTEEELKEIKRKIKKNKEVEE